MKKSVVLLFVLVALTACTQHHMAADVDGFKKACILEEMAK